MEMDPDKLPALKTTKVEEIRQIFEGLQEVEAVYKKYIEGKAHRHHMFTVDKFLANGEFDKCKG